MILAAGLSPAWQEILRFDRLQPGEVNRAADFHRCASGKVLNVGIALAHLGTESLTLAPLGGPQGAAIEAEFAALGAPTRWTASAVPTRTCITLLDAATGRTTELVENAGRLSHEELDAFAAAFREEAARAATIVFSGSFPEGTPPSYLHDLLHGIAAPVVLDVRGSQLLAALPLQPLLVKPNREELAATLGRPLETDDDLLAGMTELRHSGAQHVLITEGRRAVWLATPEANFRLRPLEVVTVNPIGCGDCLAAAIAWAVTQGSDVPDAVRYGIAAAAQNAAQLLPSRLDPNALHAQQQQVAIERLAS